MNTTSDPLSDIRAFLAESGFRFAQGGLRVNPSACQWYAYRRSDYPARECECNEGKVQQIVVQPYGYEIDGERHASAEVSLRGEASGVWWDLKAYSLSAEELKTRLPDVERSLIAAWNALTTWSNNTPEVASGGRE